MTINTVLKYSIFACIVAVAFVPMYVANPLFFPFITGKAFAFRILVEVAMALWLILILREKGDKSITKEKSVLPRFNLMTVAVTSFTLIIFVADLFGLNIMRSIWSNFERMEGFITIAHLWAYFMVLSSVINTRENWYKLFNVLLISAGITAFYGLFQFFGWTEIHQGSNRVDASLGNSAYMAVYMLINAFLAGYMAVSHAKNKVLSRSYFALFLFISFIIFQTATRGTILGWIAGILIVCTIYLILSRKEKNHSKRSRQVALGVIILFVLSGTLFYFNRDAQWIKNNNVLGRLATISISDTKTQARGFIWPMAINGVFESPKTAMIGIGQENFNYIFNSNYDPEMWAHEQWFDRAHSVYLDWLVAGGLLGLIAYLSLYILALVYIWKSDLHIGQKSILIGLLAGYGIHNVFVFDNQTSYVMFFTFLAFIYSVSKSKECSWFKNYDKHVTEDYITVRDYILVPIVVILFGTILYFFNIRPIQANSRLIVALNSCSQGETVSVDPFKNALKLDEYMANQEIREQLYICSGNVIRNQLPTQKKSEFYELVKQETAKQIESTPDDARVYILAGSFYNSIQDWSSAVPLLEKAAILTPNKQSMIFELVLSYINSGKKKEAAALMEGAYNSAVENEIARMGYIVALISNNEESKAKELFGSMPELFNDQRVIYAYVGNKQYSKAIEIYKELIKKNPNDPNLYSNLAEIYNMSGQKNLTIQTLNEVAKKFPELKDQVDKIIKSL